MAALRAGPDDAVSRVVVGVICAVLARARDEAADDEDYGDNFELLVKALQERREAGVHLYAFHERKNQLT